MTALRVLVLGSYPIQEPKHGGQIRLAQIVAAYQAREFVVKQASFFPGEVTYTSSRLGRLDTPFPPSKLGRWRGIPAPFLSDMTSGELAAADSRRVAALEDASSPVDVIHLERPWLLPMVLRLRKNGRLGPFRLVYGSANIEHVLMGDILARHGVQNAQQLVDAVRTLEIDCAREAQLVAAVTPEDAAVLEGWTSSPVVVVPNGIAPWSSTEAARHEWHKRLGDDPFALYVASAHAPNIVGLGESFGASLAGLSPIQRVVLAGQAGQFILETEWFRRSNDLNLRRVVHVGLLEQDELSALRDVAHTFILPVTSGGGSNLKTAEALYSGRHVVATPMALRGFASWSDLPGLTVAEPGHSFAAAVSKSLKEPTLAPDTLRQARRESLTWRHTLAPLCDALTESRRERA